MKSTVENASLTRGCYFLLLLITVWPSAYAQSTGTVTGTIQNAEGLPLAGAMVHFLKQSPMVRTTVITNGKGYFTVALAPDSFQVSAGIRSYATAQPENPIVVEIGKDQEVNLILKRLEDPLALEAQINGAELLSAIPSHDRRELIHRCVGCHSLGVVGGQRHSEEVWRTIVRRMSGQHPTGKGALKVRNPWENADWQDTVPKLTKYLGPESGYLDYPTYPVVNSFEELSKVVIKEFSLSRPEIYAHDIAADPLQDRVWYGDQAADRVDAVGKFGWYDPETGESKEYEVPLCQGLSRVVTDYRTGRVWVGCDNALAYWDSKTDEVVILPVDIGEDHIHGLALDSKGNVWLPLNNKTVKWNEDEFDYIAKFNPETSQVTRYQIPTPLAGAYEVQVDSKDTVWFTEIIADKIGKLEPQTGKFTEYPIPTSEGAPRRFGIDSQDNIWFVEFISNKLAKLDPTTGVITEYEVPTPFSFPYGCSVDRDDIVWFTEIFGNRIGRFDPKTETFREYPIPTPLSGIKKLDFTYTKDKVIIWGGYRVGATVIRYEFPRE